MHVALLAGPHGPTPLMHQQTCYDMFIPLARVIQKQHMVLLAGVSQLSALRRLSSLDVMYCWKLTDGAMLMLSEIESLVSLNIIGCHRLSKLGKGHVQHLLDHFHSAE